MASMGKIIPVCEDVAEAAHSALRQRVSNARDKVVATEGMLRAEIKKHISDPGALSIVQNWINAFSREHETLLNAMIDSNAMERSLAVVRYSEHERFMKKHGHEGWFA